ncbi:MAG TPA: SusD/RagB family nutrient-binding outer membrane lipoprotein [Bacteroidales bacterium]|nr:SusD/RagB family nutrient-binding outer membrane lipoprotein [Bacteroidales bacterium]
MKKLFIFLQVIIFFSSCSKLEDLNVNTKDFTSVPGESLYNGATRALVNQLFTPNVNQNNTLLWIQHWAETTYPDESRYDMVTRPVPANHMNSLYRTVLANYNEAARLISAITVIPGTTISQEQKDNQLGVIEIMSVFTWSNIVETYGDMPYSQALDFKNPTPVYDDGLTIYKDLISRLDAALLKMNPAVAGMSTGYDNIFGGTPVGTAKWIKFGNSLKLRMGIMLADLDPAYAKTVIESAASKVFTPGDKAALAFLSASPNQNPVYTELVVSGRSDFVITSNLVDAMQPTIPSGPILNVTIPDPRLKFYATTVDGVYKGGRQGNPNSYDAFSHVNPSLLTSTREVVLMDYTETEFLLAEAAERGFNVGGAAEIHYNNAITASIIYWGGTASEAEAYLVQPSVAYTTANGTFKQKIGTQAWLAYFLRGFTAWTSYRRLDFPVLTAPSLHVEGIDRVPVRYTFAVSEQTLNSVNYTAASSKIGGDTPLTKLFWDKF